MLLVNIEAPGSPLFMMLTLKDFLNIKGSSNFYIQDYNHINFDFRQNFLLNISLLEIEKLDFVILVGLNPRLELPLLNLRFRKSVKYNKSLIVSLGFSYPLTYNYLSLGSNIINLIQILENLGDAYADRTNAFSSYNNLYGEVKIPGVEGLKYRLNVGLTYRNSNSGYYLGTGALNYQTTNASSASIGNSLTTQWVLENLITYDRTFGKHKINATALYSAEQTRFNSSSIAARDVPIDAFQYFNSK